MKRLHPLRFCWEILCPGWSAIVSLALMLAYAIYLATLGDAGFDNATGLILVAQLLLASSGYRDQALRGHLDPLLAASGDRRGIALAHAALSVLPGVALWLLFGAVDHAITGRRVLPITPGGATAFIYASVAVWAVSLWLGRYTGGVLWLAGLFVLAGVGKVHVLREAYGTSNAEPLVSMRAAGAALVLPITMFGNGGFVEPPVLILIWLATLAVLGVGVWTIARMDAPLKDPS
jgi:hypothetical protein